MKETEPVMLTEILRFDINKGKRVRAKDCQLLNSFLFSKNEYYLTYKDGCYFVCISVDGELVLVWKQKEIEHGERYTPSSVISEFRIKYMKNNISQKDIDLFLSDPLGYEKTRQK